MEQTWHVREFLVDFVQHAVDLVRKYVIIIMKWAAEDQTHHAYEQFLDIVETGEQCCEEAT